MELYIWVVDVVWLKEKYLTVGAYVPEKDGHVDKHWKSNWAYTLHLSP